MAAADDVEMETVNLNTERAGKEELEEEKLREDGEGKDFPRSRKVHRIVSKWMLPEPVRRTYLERANCLPPPLFIISVSLAEVNTAAQGALTPGQTGSCRQSGDKADLRGESMREEGIEGRGQHAQPLSPHCSQSGSAQSLPTQALVSSMMEI